jgi:hypothetical protein
MPSFVSRPFGGAVSFEDVARGAFERRLLLTPQFGCRGASRLESQAWRGTLHEAGNPPSCRLDSRTPLSWPAITVGQRSRWSLKGGLLVARGGSEFLRTGPYANMLDTGVMGEWK